MLAAPLELPAGSDSHFPTRSSSFLELRKRKERWARSEEKRAAGRAADFRQKETP